MSSHRFDMAPMLAVGVTTTLATSSDPSDRFYSLSGMLHLKDVATDEIAGLQAALRSDVDPVVQSRALSVDAALSE